MADHLVKGVTPIEDFDLLDMHASLQEEHGPGAFTIEASSTPAQIVWKFTPATDPIVVEGEQEDIQYDATRSAPVGG